MMEEHVIRQGAFKAIELVEKVETVEEPKGEEHAICVVAVNSIGEVKVITTINVKEAAWYYIDECQESLDYDFNEKPGIYLVEFWIDGSKDYWGEYDSWSVIDNIIRYKVDVTDKRENEFPIKPGSEFPRCLLVVGDEGTGFILEVLNEEEASKSVLNEVVHYMEDIDKREGIESMGLYEVTFSIVGDMVNVLDRDIDEDIKLSDIKRIILELEDNPAKRLLRKEKIDRESQLFCKYVDELMMRDEHIR